MTTTINKDAIKKEKAKLYSVVSNTNGNKNVNKRKYEGA